MPTTRQANVNAAQWSMTGSHIDALSNAAGTAIYGENVFGTPQQRQRLPKDVFKRLQRTIDQGHVLDPDLADAVASAMKDWAIERGATHYTHWFQPLTGMTAEKHDSFLSPSGDGTALAEFSGKELVRGEPDASSFPTGGLRATFEARGYTAWDPTSPAFLLENPNGTALCIPTAFASWTGEALDSKIPLLRSMDALSKAAMRALALFGDTDVNRVFTTVGPEQEYFLIDEQYYFARPDLITTGRTLFGAKPAKGQELDDHYFGTIPDRVLAYMMEVEYELMRLGVPIKTRHNEVAPGQYELAPVFENTNVGCDHQQLTMIVMQRVARNYGLVCLLHEKPFARINGSGKHNNWSMGTDTGQNLLNPGSDPHTNAEFLFFCTAVIAAVNRHQGLLRASVATAGQDHRLGANEAPPAIISIFLGSELEKVFGAISKGRTGKSTPQSFMGLGTPVLPPLPMDAGDRNRTSPFAFTGNRFEFRALGSSMSTGFPNTVLNTIVAEAIDHLCDAIEKAKGAKKSVDDVLADVLRESYNANSRVIFGGDGYSAAWHKEAAKRGLLNLRTTPEALTQITSPESVQAFGHYGVLSERELESRRDVFIEQYVTKVNIEGETAATIARTLILPAALRHLVLTKEAGVAGLEAEVQGLTDDLIATIHALEAANAVHAGDDPFVEAEHMRDKVLPAMLAVREVADVLERVVADHFWPLPRYSEMLFIR